MDMLQTNPTSVTLRGGGGGGGGHNCSWPGQEMDRFLKAQSSNSVLSRQTVNKGYQLTRIVSTTRLAVLSEKLTGSHYTEPVKSRVPSG